ncbi:MAG TPA: cytochrome C oxidase subunit IV family protein [Candidatus Methylacidiphilales bacterium]
MKTLLLAFAGLLGLLALAVAAAFLPLGGFNLAASLVLAAAQAGLILVFFTEWREGDAPSRLALFVGLVWLAFLFALVRTDLGVRPPGTLLLP